jgi:hypothetical protein
MPALPGQGTIGLYPCRCGFVKNGDGKGSDFKHVILRFGGSSTRLEGGSSWLAALILFAINDACWKLEICRIVLGISLGNSRIIRRGYGVAGTKDAD